MNWNIVKCNNTMHYFYINAFHPNVYGFFLLFTMRKAQKFLASMFTKQTEKHTQTKKKKIRNTKVLWFSLAKEAKYVSGANESARIKRCDVNDDGNAKRTQFCTFHRFTKHFITFYIVIMRIIAIGRNAQLNLNQSQLRFFFFVFFLLLPFVVGEAVVSFVSQSALNAFSLFCSLLSLYLYVYFSRDATIPKGRETQVFGFEFSSFYNMLSHYNGSVHFLCLLFSTQIFLTCFVLFHLYMQKRNFIIKIIERMCDCGKLNILNLV